jgi:hypothetical protein
MICRTQSISNRAKEKLLITRLGTKELADTQAFEVSRKTFYFRKYDANALSS